VVFLWLGVGEVWWGRCFFFFFLGFFLRSLGECLFEDGCGRLGLFFFFFFFFVFFFYVFFLNVFLFFFFFFLFRLVPFSPRAPSHSISQSFVPVRQAALIEFDLRSPASLPAFEFLSFFCYFGPLFYPQFE